MEEQDKNIPQLEIEQSPTKGSGAILATAREEANKSIEEVAEKLNLSASQISAIERDQKDELPEPTYVRGYIRAYAKLLDLDPDEVLLSYKSSDWDKGSNLGDIPVGIEVKESRQIKLSSARNILLLGLLLAAVFYWYFVRESGSNLDSSARSGSVTQEVSRTETERLIDNSNQAVSVESGSRQIDRGEDENVTTSDDAADVDVVEVSDSIGDANDKAEVVNEGGETAPEEPLSATENTQLAAEAMANEPSELATETADSAASEAAGINNLVIEFIETSWIDIRDSEEQRIAYRSYAKGERLVVNQPGSLKVLIGNADGVSVRLNEEPYNLAPHINGPYAEFVVE